MQQIRTKLIIVGAGGLGLEAMWTARAMGVWEILGYADGDASRIGQEHYGDPVCCLPEAIVETCGGDVCVHLAVGKNATRRKLLRVVEGQGLSLATLQHPEARIADGAELGEGSYLAAGATLAPYAQVGRCCLINLNAVVGHEVVLGDFCQVSPGAVITGQCQLGEGVFLGSNASIYPGLSVGDWATVGANSFALTPVMAGSTVMGNPARPFFNAHDRIRD